MCLFPKYLIRPNMHLNTWNDTQHYKLYKVPCGHCVECLKHRQNTVAVRVMNEAINHKDVSFLTLTYNDKNLPISQRLWVSYPSGESMPLDSCRLVDNESFLEFVREKMSRIRVEKYRTPRYMQHRIPVFDGAYGEGTEFFLRLTPSLNRRDVRLWLKSGRVAYKREFGKPLPDFKYVLCGEYGTRTCRPHYHLIILGLPFHDVDWLTDRWLYGFSYCKKVKDTNKDKIAVARYISKYVAKGDFECSSAVSRDCERPRLCSSVHLGLPESFNFSYFFCFDMFGKYDPDTLKLEKGDYLSDSQLKQLFPELLKRMSFKVPDCNYFLPLPLQWKRQIYYHKQKYGEKIHYVPKTIFRLLSEDLQLKDVSTRERQFELFAKSLPFGTSYPEAFLQFEDSLRDSSFKDNEARKKAFKYFYTRDSF